jgi:hypothetical protein
VLYWTGEQIFDWYMSARKEARTGAAA